MEQIWERERNEEPQGGQGNEEIASIKRPSLFTPALLISIPPTICYPQYHRHSDLGWCGKGMYPLRHISSLGLMGIPSLTLSPRQRLPYLWSMSRFDLELERTLPSQLKSLVYVRQVISDNRPMKLSARESGRKKKSKEG